MASIEQSAVKSTPQKMGLEPLPAPGTGGPSYDPAQPTYSRFLATPLPLLSTYQPDALRQFYRGGIPQQRIFPVQNG